MDNRKWLCHLESHQPHIVGEFENQLGERYVIYRNKNGDTPYITGDELDWHIGHRLLWNNAEFMFAAEERDQIVRILWPTMEELYLKAKEMTPDAREELLQQMAAETKRTRKPRG